MKVATAQFAVSADIDANGAAIERLMRRARAGGADVIHFPEAALSGYAGVDFDGKVSLPSWALCPGPMSEADFACRSSWGGRAEIRRPLSCS